VIVLEFQNVVLLDAEELAKSQLALLRKFVALWLVIVVLLLEVI
jgi:hypothetical protein